MLRGVLLDTGPLVAYFCPGERHHEWAVRQFETFVPPALTCEAVLAESCFLLARAGVSPDRVLAKLSQGALRIGLSLEQEAGALASLMQRYANLPMSLADACLVRLAETRPGPLCTLDRDFRVYRRNGHVPLDLIMPEDL
ncbi:MAG: PIN domain-containing protein [Rhodocyclaceae bacterium]|jgi:predicted nucleic acid-binding protein|nr:PIN domain-containing protein [Rhodocyclaceae bacterium]